MQVQIREALITAVKTPFLAAYPDIPIVWDNFSFDRNSAPNVWVEFEIKFSGGRQIGMSENPNTRISGYVYATIWIKYGNGTKTALSIADWFTNTLKYLRLPNLTLGAPEPETPDPPDGWHTEQIKLYFYS